MITLQTGLPGGGKTLVTLDNLISIQKANYNAHDDDPDKNPIRPIYYYNIKGLKSSLGWIQLSEEQVMKWYLLPPNSIIVIDEAQDVFPPISPSKTEEHYSKLNTHRHDGKDLYLITQAGTLIDSRVRKLVGEHKHIERKANSKVTTLYTNNRYQEEVAMMKSKEVQKKPYVHNKKIFGVYKSAEFHTMKVRFPIKIIILIGILVALIFVGISMFKSTVSGLTGDEIAEAESSPGTKPDISESEVKALLTPEYKPDTFIDGVMKGRTVFITALTTYGSFFDINGATFKDSQLRLLGYNVNVFTSCFAVINNTPVSCPPDDYYGEEYYPYDEERNKRGKDRKKRNDGKKGNKDEETESA